MHTLLQIYIAVWCIVSFHNNTLTFIFCHESHMNTLNVKFLTRCETDFNEHVPNLLGGRVLHFYNDFSLRHRFINFRRYFFRYTVSLPEWRNLRLTYAFHFESLLVMVIIIIWLHNCTSVYNIGYKLVSSEHIYITRNTSTSPTFYTRPKPLKM